MPKLIITRGIPASGKSFRATEWVSADPRTRARVNRDLLRGMLHNGVYLQPLAGVDGTESAVTAVRDAAIFKLLKHEELDVVCDDTNLPTRVALNLYQLAAAAGAEFEVWDLTDVPLEECLYRNSLREGPARVPSDRIVDMHTRFVAGKGYPLPIPELTEVIQVAEGNF